MGVTLSFVPLYLWEVSNEKSLSIDESSPNSGYRIVAALVIVLSEFLIRVVFQPIIM